MIPSLVAEDWKTTLIDYIDTVFPFRDERVANAFLEYLRDEKDGLFRGPYVHAQIPFRQADADEPLPLVHFQPQFTPYIHQLNAFKRLVSSRQDGPQPTLVTTGTGSGKTESFLYPILDHCIRERRAGRAGIKAIILYPMNALAQDQAKRLAELIANHSEARRFVTAGLYVGVGDGNYRGTANVSKAMTAERLIEERKLLRSNPPDILLTNYKMLDMLLLRKADWPLWSKNTSDTLRYLVLDELHTYDGVQSADIAYLIRRLTSRLRIPSGALCPVGTSATLGDGNSTEKLREYAGKVFGIPFPEDSVVQESRPSLGEFLLPLESDAFPPPSDNLWPSAQETAAAYALRQRHIWFGELEGEELTRALRGHAWLHQLCRTAIKGPLPWHDLVLSFQKEFGITSEDEGEGLLQSFLTVVGEAKWIDGRRPLLPVQVQLWVREMRGVGRLVADEPRFVWTHRPEDADESDVETISALGSVSDGDGSRVALPNLVCRSCGAGGWAALRDPMEPHALITEARAIVSAVSNADSLSQAEREHIIYLYPLTESTPTYGRVNDGKSEPFFLTPGGNLMERTLPGAVRVNVVQPYVDSQSRKGPSLKDSTCPHCRQRQALSIVSMRRASIGAVLASQVLGTEHASDPKVLSFVDSVQDSALLAGFIQHRAKNGLMRTALVHQMQLNEQPVTLNDAMNVWPQLWRKDMKDKEFIRAFIDTDESDEQIADRYPRSLEDWSNETWTDAMEYVSARIWQEFTLHARLVRSRSLYQTGIAVLRPDPERVAQAVNAAVETIVERYAHLNTSGELSSRLTGWAQGIIHRMMLDGGVSHNLLANFRATGGNRFLLSRDRNRNYPGSVRVPSFYTTSNRSTDGLTTLYGPNNSWLALFTATCLQHELNEHNFGIQLDHGDIAHTFFVAMRDTGLVDVVHHGADQTYGLRPTALVIDQDTTRLVCKKCKSEITVSAEDAATFIHHGRCLVYRCDGHYEEAHSRRNRYARHIYEESRIVPPIVKEHSSLVPNEERRVLERRFEKGEPEPLNVLICTPTMEMGIDIGDLSTVVLTGVPPTIANRVQRVGRAGRSTGKSLIAQIVREQPHDQYFWESPRELLSGHVEPPTCPLDAPQVLRRHLRAYLLDAWIRDRPEATIPAKASRVVLEAASAQGFPELFYSYVDANQEVLWDEFEARFLDGLRTDSIADVRESFVEGDWIQETDRVIATRREEEREARRHLERLNRRLQEQEFQAQDAAKTQEYRDLERTVYQARARHRTLLQESTLEWWTNEGLLPNFTFPERPVTLRRYRGRGLIETFDRPQREAIRDLAPGRVFYARGHRSPVTQISLGTHEQALEKWRLCSVCQHMEPEGEVVASVCPVCGSPEWQDTGRLANMIRLRRVSSREVSRDEKITDDEEERQRSSAVVEMFFEFPEAPVRAGELRGHPFGYELFRKVTVRELNFGPREGGGQGERHVAGQDVPKAGFEICDECGAVALPNGHGQKTIKHVPGYSCDRTRVRDMSAQMVDQGTNQRLSQGDEHRTETYIYREFESEALRFLLPVGQALLEERLANWLAMLRLGLQEHLGGSARQIGMAAYEAPLAGDADVRTRYIVLFDTVPGGTGYLRQLAEPGEVHAMLAKALNVLTQCSCQHEHRRACYRCLMRYELQYEHDLLSRQLSVEMLQPLVEAGAHAWQISDVLDPSTLSNRPEGAESDLEILAENRLLERLRGYGGGVRVRTVPLSQSNHHGHRIVIDRQGQKVVWEFIRQGPLSRDAALFATRPDWLIRPVDDPDSETASRKTRPVAVYCDGAAYHIGEGDRDRLPRDILQREAIRRSGQYMVINVTYRDLEQEDSLHMPELYPEFPATLAGLAQQFGAGLSPKFIWEANALALLCHYLVYPDADGWSRLGQAVGLAVANIRKPDLRTSVNSALSLVGHAQVADAKAPYLDRLSDEITQQVVMTEHTLGSSAELSVLLTATNTKNGPLFDGVVRLNDSSVIRHDQEFGVLWKAFLEWFNILQWVPNIRFMTTRSLILYREDWQQLNLLRPVYGMGSFSVHQRSTPKWIELVVEELRGAALALVEAGVPEPEVGYELMKDGFVVAEAELAWPEWQVAVFRHESEDTEVAKQLGWHVWDVGLILAASEQADDILEQWTRLRERRG